MKSSSTPSPPSSECGDAEDDAERAHGSEDDVGHGGGGDDGRSPERRPVGQGETIGDAGADSDAGGADGATSKGIDDVDEGLDRIDASGEGHRQLRPSSSSSSLVDSDSDVSGPVGSPSASLLGGSSEELASTGVGVERSLDSDAERGPLGEDDGDGEGEVEEEGGEGGMMSNGDDRGSGGSSEVASSSTASTVSSSSSSSYDEDDGRGETFESSTMATGDPSEPHNRTDDTEEGGLDAGTMIPIAPGVNARIVCCTSDEIRRGVDHLIEVELTGPGACMAIRGRCPGVGYNARRRGHHRRRERLSSSTTTSSGRARLRVLRGAVEVLGYTIHARGVSTGGDDVGGGKGTGGDSDAKVAATVAGDATAITTGGDDDRAVVTIDSPPFLSSLVISNAATSDRNFDVDERKCAGKDDHDGGAMIGRDDDDRPKPNPPGECDDGAAAPAPHPPPLLSTVLIWNADDDEVEVDGDVNNENSTLLASRRRKRRRLGDRHHHHHHRQGSSKGRKEQKTTKRRRRNGEKDTMEEAKNSQYGPPQGDECRVQLHELDEERRRREFRRHLDHLFDFDLIDPTTGLPFCYRHSHVDDGDDDGGGRASDVPVQVSVVHIPPCWERAIDAVVADDRRARNHRQHARDDDGGTGGDDREREGGVDGEGVWRDALWWRMHRRRRRSRIRPRQPPPPRPPRILICGAKGVGKSTMLRYTVNRLLSSSSCARALAPAAGPAPESYEDHKAPTPTVMVLDCDAGQPELGVPGMLSLTAVSRPLLSPPHSHVVVARRGTACGDGTGTGVAVAGDPAPRGGDANVGETTAGTMKTGGGEYGAGGVGCFDGRGRGCSAAAVGGHEMAYYYGYITSRVDPARYLQMVSDLVAVYDDTVGRCYESPSRLNHKEDVAYIYADADGGDDWSCDIEADNEGDRNSDCNAESSSHPTMDTEDDRAPPWPPPSCPPRPPPLVVNTDGWVKSMGADILGAVIDAVRPDHVVQIVGSKRSKRFDLSGVLSTVSYAAVAASTPSDPMVGATRCGAGEDGGDAAAGHTMLHVVDSFGFGEMAAAAPGAEATVSSSLPPRQEHNFEEDGGGNTPEEESKSTPPHDPLTPEDDAGGPARSDFEYRPPAARPSLEYDGIDASPDRRCLEIARADFNMPPAFSPSRPAVAGDPGPHPSSPFARTFPIFNPPPSVSSAHLRSLRLCCYFLGGARNFTLLGGHFDPRRGGIVDTENAIARALAAEAPHAVPFDGVQCVILGEEGEALCSSTELVLDVLNGSVVGLCVSGPGLRRGGVNLGDNDDDGHGGTNASSFRCPSHGPCVGLGIVRAVVHRSQCEGEGHGTTTSSKTTATATLFVLTPVGCDALHHVDTLVVGRITLPVECGYRGGAYSESCPFYDLQQA